MQRILQALVCVCVVAVVCAVSPLADEQRAFVTFINTYSKVYDSTAATFERFTIFQSNLAIINAHNAANHTWHMGIGPFADLTSDEFLQQYAQGLTVPADYVPPTNAPQFTGNGPFDWVKAGKVTSIKNQGNCGSCWAFATSAGVESYLAIKGSLGLTDLSPQHLVDCARTSQCHGCQGGWMLDAMAWIAQNGGQCDWASYPYHGVQGQCNGGCHKVAHIGGGSGVSGEGGIESAGGHQPVIVGLDVSNWQHYAGGLYTGGCAAQPQHAVVVVGAGRLQNQPAWQIKNSWGTGWGAGGFIFMQAGRNLCGIGNWPCIPH